MYLSGIPLGLLVDTKGPRAGLALGGLLLVAGYYPIKIGIFNRLAFDMNCLIAYQHMTRVKDRSASRFYPSSLI